MEKKHIKKVAVIGAESTGKSVLCEQLAKHFSTVWVPEYAREYFNDSDIYNYTLKDLEIIAQRQLALEAEYLQHANTYLFCDTAMITLKIWADLEFGKPSEQLQTLIDQGSYDLYLICDNSVPWQPDTQRLNKFSREMIFDLNREAASLSKIKTVVISGIGRQRLEQAIEACH
jgi:NadR type nicotinamide-nucleotide adenylyltransferase